MSIFRKKAKKFIVNDEEVMIRPLGMRAIMDLQSLKGPIAMAIAKLRSVSVNDYEEVTHTTPMPTDNDPDAIELIKKESHTAPSSEAIIQAIENKAQGIEAIFDCLFQERLLSKILYTSIEGIAYDDSDKILDEMDMPTMIEILGHIIEVNMGGFESLGKSWHPLIESLKAMGAKA